MARTSHAAMICELATRGGEGLPARGVAPHVLASWRRCLEEYRLEPDRVALPHVLTAGELARASAPIEDVVALARPELERLFLRLRAHGFVVTLAERGGASILFRGEASLPEAFVRTRNVIGAVSSEERQGTNGIGTCLSEGRPLVVDREAHFDSRVTGFTCIAAPILGAGREPVAVLNASCWRLSRAVAPDLVLDLVAQSARRIANGFFARRHAARRVLRVSRFGDFTDAGAEGRLALDAEDRIVDATVEALSLVGGVGVSPIGMRLAELPLLDPDDPGVDTAARRPAGGRLFARLLETPRRWRPRRPPAVAMRRSTHPDLAEIQGLDPTLETAIARAGRIVAQGVPLLIAGETGVGKTALAQALHAAGPWRAGGFAQLDCAAAGTTELEAAFARRRDDPGPGTLFLDAAGDLAPASQARLVALLAREEETPVAGALIAACTRGPAEEPGSTLRPDLRFRLAGFVLDMPPLRARADRDDVIERVLRDEARRAGLVAAAPDPAVLRALRAHPWPGNFRELRHAARAAIACAHGGKVTLATLPDALRAAEAPPPAARPARRRDAIEAALQRAGWNVRRAALALGMSRATLHRRIRALGLARPARSRAPGGAAGLRS